MPAGDPPGQGVGDGPGLLEYFLLHEMGVPGLFGHGRRPGDGVDLAVGAAPIHVFDGIGAVLDLHQIPVVQEHHPVGVGQEGRHVRGQEEFALAEAQHHGRVLARPDQQAGLAAVHHHQGIGAADAAHGRLQGQGQVVAALGQQGYDEVGHDLGVGLRGEHATGGLQFLL